MAGFDNGRGQNDIAPVRFHVYAGGQPPGAYRPEEIGKHLGLRYGPSVEQALLAATDGDGVYEELSPEALDFMVGEFHRQIELLEKSNG